MSKNETLNPLQSIRDTVSFSSRDMAHDKRNAWIYGIIFGWDDYERFQERFGWSNDAVKKLKILHKNFQNLEETSEIKFGEY